MQPINQIAWTLVLGIATLSLPSVQAQQVPAPQVAADGLDTPPGTVMTQGIRRDVRPARCITTT